jgi:serine/threonine protein kinase
MGEVYRARDERLERDVAIKVLPEAVAQHPDRLARFEREAKAVAKLAHPNILEIHDFGREGDVTYAVTELLEGETLHAHLDVHHGPLPWKRVREIGAAVADGMAAAHGRGVVHRDLKPENIFITSDGRVKILDFGLARVERPVSEEDETATLTPAGTVAGTVLGTPGYMSPEQVRGQPADARSDVFALGCVLYELLSGRRAFRGDTAADTQSAILNQDPPPFSASGVAVGPELSRTIERCLEKKPERRFQSASDLAFALRAIVSDTDEVRTAPAPVALPGRRRWPWAAAAVAVAAGATAVALNVAGLRDRLVGTGSPGAIRSLAVLPLTNLSGDPTA